MEYWSIVIELVLGTIFVCLLFIGSPYFQVAFWLLALSKVLQILARCQCLWVPTNDSGTTSMKLSLILEVSLLLLIGLFTLMPSPKAEFLINIFGPLLSMGSPIFFASFFKHSAGIRSHQEVVSQAETSITLMSVAGGGFVFFSLLGDGLREGRGSIALILLFLLLAAFLSYARLLEKIIQALKAPHSIEIQ